MAHDRLRVLRPLDRVADVHMSRAAATYDSEHGVWMVPMSDSHLNLHSRAWSEHVQFRAVKGPLGFEIRVRSARRPDAHMIVAELARSGKILGSEAVVARLLGERV